MFNTRMDTSPEARDARDVLEKAIDKHTNRINNYENKDLVENSP